MKKTLQFILILIVAVGSFLSPISGAFNRNGEFHLQKNEARAATVTASNYSAIINISRTYDISIDATIIFKSQHDGDYQLLSDNNMTFAVTWVPTDNTKLQEIKKYFAILPRPVVEIGSLLDWLTPVNNIYPTINDDNTIAHGFSLRMGGLTPDTEYTVQVIYGNSSGSTALTTTTVRTNQKGVGGQGSSESSLLSTDDLVPACGIIDGSIYGCIIQVFYYAAWMPTSWLAGLAGKIMDFFIFYSISSTSYSQGGFVGEGWKVIRDIANIAFIFVLLYIALRTILNLGGSNSKKMISWVVFIALIINFSLFFSKVIVDSGNILAGVLYNNIGAVATKDGQSAPVAKGEAGEESISVGIVSQFDPQKIFASAGVTPQNIEEMKTPYLVVIVLATIINIFMITTFLSICLFFVGRTIGMMISMIFSPFAFVSLTIPGAGSIMKEWSWEKWFPELVKMALMAPVFIFFLWLIMLFLNVGLLKGMGDKLAQDGNALGTMVTVILPFIIIIGLLTKAKEVAQEMAGTLAAQLNKQVSGVLKTVGGFALGAASGGLALAGRATLGRGATAALSGERGEALRAAAARGDAGARLQLKTYEALSKTSFDPRKTLAAKTLQERTGLSLATPAVRVPLVNMDLKTEGGYRGRVEREKKRAQDESELYKTTGPEADTRNENAKKWNENYEKARNNAEEAEGPDFNEKNFKKKYEGGQAPSYQKDPTTNKFVPETTKDASGKDVPKTVGTPPVLKTEEFNAKKMRDRAGNIKYGENYAKERDSAKEDWTTEIAKDIATNGKQTIKDFDEKVWRESLSAKRAEFAQKSQQTTRAEEEIISDLKKRAGEEEKKEKPISPREKAQAQKTLEQSTARLSEIDKSLKELAKDYEAAGHGKIDDVNKITQKEVKQITDSLKKNLTTAKANLEGAKASLMRDPKNKTNIANLATAMAKVDEHETKISTYNSALPEREAQSKNKYDATQKLGY